MNTPTTLTASECESLLSLSDSELTSILRQLSTEQQSSILRQLYSHRPPTELQRQIQKNLEVYYPHVLSRRQRVFLDLTDEEAFYGGAAGGGKSDALICAALQYIHVPGYQAIVFRRTNPNLEEIVQRTQEWFAGRASWNGQKHRWTFDNPGGQSRLYLGHMQHEVDKFNYKGQEFQFIGWDEATEFIETQYTYLFSRLRRPKCNRHKVAKQDCPTCRRAMLLGAVPLRVRAASNPDGEGRDWVRRRWVSQEAAEAICSGNYGTLYFNEYEGHRIPFVPSRATDNPGLDVESYYDKSLSRLDPVTRERLKMGDWLIRADGLIRQEWLRYFEMRGQIIQLLGADGKVHAHCDERECRRFVTIDPAGTSAERSKEAKGNPHSWSVAQVWDVLPSKFGQNLVLRHVWRARVDFPGLLQGITKVFREWNPSKLLIENEKLGVAVVPMLQGIMPITCCHTGGKDKVTRAAPLLNMLQKGQVYLPRYDADWRPALESEWLSWQGLEDQVADQIDPASYAAIEVGSGSSSVIPVDFAFWNGTG